MWEALLAWQASLPPWAADTWRCANGLVLLTLLLAPLERRLGRPQATFRDGWSTDVGWYFLTSLLPGRVLVLPVAAMLWLLPPVASGGLWPALAALPAAPRLAIALLVAEFGSYWGHRAMHGVPWLWRFHAVHHSASNMDWLVNTRVHPVDSLVVRSAGLLPLYALGLARPHDAGLDWLPLVVGLVASVWGYVIHANVRVRLGVLEYVVATPLFHHWHHENLGAGVRAHANYAAFLPVFDRVFGTFRSPLEAWPSRYGTGEPPLPTLVDQLIGPFMGDVPPPVSDG